MPWGELTNVKEIKAGDEILNLGIVEKAEHAPVAKLSNFTIIQSKCLSAAFYWFRSDINLWVIKAKSN